MSPGLAVAQRCSSEAQEHIICVMIDSGVVIDSCCVCMRVLQTALHWAAKQGRVEMVDMMARSGADVNQRAVRADRSQRPTDTLTFTPLQGPAHTTHTKHTHKLTPPPAAQPARIMCVFAYNCSVISL